MPVPEVPVLTPTYQLTNLQLIEANHLHHVVGLFFWLISCVMLTGFWIGVRAPSPSPAVITKTRWKVHSGLREHNSH